MIDLLLSNFFALSVGACLRYICAALLHMAADN